MANATRKPPYRGVMALFAFPLVVGCSSDGPPRLPGLAPPPCALEERGYLVERIEIPSTTDEAVAAAFDLDGDGGRDNNTGFVLQELNDLQGGDVLGSAIVDAFATGNVLWAIVLEECEQSTEPFARARLQLARDVDSNPENNLDGTGLVELIGPSPIPAVGVREGGTLHVGDGFGVVPMSTLFDVEAANRDAVWVDSAGLRIQATIDGVKLRGTLGAATEMIPTVEAAVAPAARTLQSAVAADPGCPDSCVTSEAQELLDLFDIDGNGVITETDLRMHAWPSTLLAPCTDLTAEHDGETVYWPGHDGLRDHVGVGLAFEAVTVGLSGP